MIQTWFVARGRSRPLSNAHNFGRLDRCPDFNEAWLAREVMMATPCKLPFTIQASRFLHHIGNAQLWERPHVGFGGTERKRKGPCTKQCAWRKHVKHSRRDAPKVAILEAPCAQNLPGRGTMRPPEALLPRNATWEPLTITAVRSSSTS